MAATFQWSESNGSGEVVTDNISNLNFGSIDAPNLNPLSYPISAGDNSYSKYIRAKFTGDFTEISNMKFWKSAGQYKTGESITATANVSYSTPTQQDVGGNPIPESEDEALSILSAEGNSVIENGASGVSGYSGYIRLQLKSSFSTPAGATNQKTFTFQYDEI